MNQAATHRSSRTVMWAVLPFGVAAVLLLILLATRSPGSERAADSRLLGAVAPLIDGPTIDGERFDIDDHRGEWVLVNFFSTTCVPCIQEHSELVLFQAAHASAGDATVVSITFDDQPSNVVAFFAQHGGDWPVLVEDTSGFAVRYGVTGVPESYLVAPSGVVAAKFVGGITADAIDSRIAALLEAAAA